MAGHGGARNRSGPPVDPNSERSEQRGLAFKLLPRGGFEGKIPRFPLPDATARERAVWRLIWRTPQAAMWNAEPWRIIAAADYCRWKVRAEAADAPASAMGATLRLADQLGLTPAGLKENGWRIAADEVGQKRETTPAADGESVEPARERSGRRLRAVGE